MMIYLALGDSITYGYDTTADSEQYVKKLVQKLNEKNRASFYVHAKPGWTSLQLLRSLEQIPECIIQEAELISLLIGGNDLIKSMPWFLDNRVTAMERLRAAFFPQVKAIVKKVKVHPQATMYLCTIYNPFPNAELAQYAIDGLNGILRQVADQEGCVVVPVDHYYGGKEQDFVNGYKKGTLEDFRLFKNPIHPNDLGHARIAEAIFDVIEKTADSVKTPKKKSPSGKRQPSVKKSKHK